MSNTHRRDKRRGRPPGGVSPADLPKPIRDRAYRLTVYERKMISVVYRGLGLAGMGVNPRTFRHHVATWRRRESERLTRHGQDSTRETRLGAARAFVSGFRLLGLDGETIAAVARAMCESCGLANVGGVR